ncbi:hypothetical protein WMF18_12570 [Sorangium sp. So ce315]|uniref:hypothetical protein n=1 Tax=Sorangium sp. So ce315 TaxID=3133299 RepID=UPI003F5F2412
MPKNLSVYSCLIISPSDVTKERDAAVEVIENWNAHVGAGLQARIEAVRWESHARPEMGAPAQDIINQQLVDQCDFGIAIFWSRLGSPTEKHPSGSAEEIDRLLRRGSKVMVYFSTQPIPQDALRDDQFSRLQELKKRYQHEGLLATFDNVAILRERLQLHITSLVTELLLNARAGGQPIPSTGTLTAPTPDIRVIVAGGIAARGPATVPIVSVTIQNHSPNDFFFHSILFELSDGDRLFFERDAITADYLRPCKIEPGNSFSFHVNPGEARDALKGRSIVSAVASDKIGRMYRSTTADMETAMNNYDSFAKIAAKRRR